MPTEVYKIVQKELETIVGDILSVGMLKKGLAKVGSNPDSVDKIAMAKALDVHVKQALVSFMGPKDAPSYVADLKKKIGILPQGGP